MCDTIGTPPNLGCIIKAALVLFLLSGSAPGLTVLSGPSFIPAKNAPLAGLLSLTTDVGARVSVDVDDGTSTWSRSFYVYTNQQFLPLVGFHPGRTNRILVTATDKQRNSTVVTQSVIFVSPPLPVDFPRIKLLTNQPERLEPGYTLFRVAINSATKGYHVIVDGSGQVVWYSSTASQLDVRQLPNGNLFFFSPTNFVEMNLVGQTVRTWSVPKGATINPHDGLFTTHNTILYLSDAGAVVTNYPTSTTLSNAPTRTATNVVYQRVVEISATNSAVLNTWSMIGMLDPRRITYMMTLGTSVCDSEHCNSVVENPEGDSIIVSLRHQNAVIKFSRTTGQLIWILGPHENWGPQWQPYLLTPVGSPFSWQYGQHSATLTPSGTLLLYDNGNYRATPFGASVPDPANYSRGVEYQIDETLMEVSQVWDYGSNQRERLYTDRVGNAEPLPLTGNILVTFGSVRYVNGVAPSSYGPSASMARIKEISHDTPPEVLFDLAVTEYDNTSNAYKDCYVYRSWRIPDLYGHPALPVRDLTVSAVDGYPLLEFSADPARAYTIQASDDLSAWHDIGEATLNTEQSNYQFVDMEATGSTPRYYRAITR